MDNLKIPPVLGAKGQGVRLDKIKRIARLWYKINAHDLVKPGAIIPHRGAPRPTK